MCLLKESIPESLKLRDYRVSVLARVMAERLNLETVLLVIFL